MFNYSERVLTGDALVFYKRKILELPNGRTAVVFNNVMKELTAHIFLVHAYREQKRYMGRFLRKPKEMTTCEYFTRVQEINNHRTLFPTDTEEVATVMSDDELIKTLFHVLPDTWMTTNLVMQGFNYAQHNLADLLETCD